MERKSYVYKISCKITGEYYFGSSFNAKRDSYWGKGRKIKERIAQYGKENFVKEILEEFDDRVDAHKKENYYIEKFRNDNKCLNIHIDHHFGTYNDKSRAKIGAANAISLRGKTLSKEHKAKLSDAMCGEKNHNFGKHFSDEHRAKISAGNRGKIVSEESRAKMSAAQRGKHLSATTRAKLSASHRGENNPMYGKHLSEETKQKIREYRRGRTPWNKGKKLNKETGKYE